MQRRLGAASPRLASGVYIDRKGVKRGAARWTSQDDPSSTKFGSRAPNERDWRNWQTSGDGGTRTLQALSSTGTQRRRRSHFTRPARLGSVAKV
jgi:hypothetical protein